MNSLFKLILFTVLLILVHKVNASCISAKVSGTGQAILLMPGFISDERVWDDVASELSHNFEVHQLAIAGFGHNPACDKAEDIYQQTLVDVKHYIRSKTLSNPVFIGHSMGGLIAFQLGIDKSVQLNAVVSVDGLPFIGPVFTGTNDTKIDDLAYQAQAIRSLYENASQENIKRMTQQGIGIQTGERSRVDTLLSMAEQSDPKTAGSAIYSVMTTDLRSQMQNAQVPILLVGASGGYNDPKQQQAAQKLYETQIATAPDATVIMNTKGRHFLMWDQQEWLISTITQYVKERS